MPSLPLIKVFCVLEWILGKFANKWMFSKSRKVTLLDVGVKEWFETVVQIKGK